MINVNLDIKNKVRETTKSMLLEISEYETWFPIKDTIINKNNKKNNIKNNWRFERVTSKLQKTMF